MQEIPVHRKLRRTIQYTCAALRRPGQRRPRYGPVWIFRFPGCTFEWPTRCPRRRDRRPRPKAGDLLPRCKRTRPAALSEPDVTYHPGCPPTRVPHIPVSHANSRHGALNRIPAAKRPKQLAGFLLTGSKLQVISARHWLSIRIELS